MSIQVQLRTNGAATRALPRQRGGAGRPEWMRRYVAAAVMFDAAMALAASEVARGVRFGNLDATFSGGGLGTSYAVLSLLIAPIWVASMAAGGAYQARELGNGQEEYRRVLNSALRVVAAVAIVAFAFELDLARGFVGILLPLATVLTLFSRYRLRKWVHNQRGRGGYSLQVIVVGTADDATSLIRHLRRATHAGFSVLGACIASDQESLDIDGTPVTVLAQPHEVLEVAKATNADAIAIAGTSTLGSRSLRELGWEMEGTGIDLIVVPALTDIAGPRIATRPVAGLPLLHVEEPALSGPVRVVRDLVDRALALSVLLILAPFLAVIAVAVRATSHGPAFFKQVRVGLDGSEFVVWKFRTMRRDAEGELSALAEHNDHDGVLFKVRNDPRRTPLGRRLRRASVDELPQLWNVVRGDMSIVGPRPPLPSEVERYTHSVRRRLMVKPGLTGLWQVSGRADLSWEESVRLDLYYVENWSLALDATILWKTIAAVISGRGAY